MLILGAISINELGPFFISSRGISSDLGRGILGDPSRDFVRLEELSRDLASFRRLLLVIAGSFFRLDSLLGLSPKVHF